MERSICSTFHTPDVTVVALVPSVGPKPPAIRVVQPPASAVLSICGQIKCTWVSIPPAVTMVEPQLIASVAGPQTKPGVTPSMVLGLPALPIPTILPALIPMSALTTPWIGSMMVAFVSTKSKQPELLVAALSKPIPSRSVLPPPNTASSP